MGLDTHYQLEEVEEMLCDQSIDALSEVHKMESNSGCKEYSLQEKVDEKVQLVEETWERSSAPQQIVLGEEWMLK